MLPVNSKDDFEHKNKDKQIETFECFQELNGNQIMLNKNEKENVIFLIFFISYSNLIDSSSFHLCLHIN